MESDPPDIGILRQAGDWRWIQDGDIVRAAALAHAAARRRPATQQAAPQPWASGAHGVDITILLADDACLHDLNLRFRGQDRPTDILSFPAQCFYHTFDRAREQSPWAPPCCTDIRYLLGDIALSAPAVRRGARARGRHRRAHLLHLIVHGVLHLCGHVHRQAGEAHAMEALETAALAQMSIADPYADIHADPDAGPDAAGGEAPGRRAMPSSPPACA